jgi:hypothetical protein
MFTKFLRRSVFPCAAIALLALRPSSSESSGRREDQARPGPIERIGKDILQLGQVRVNLATREVSVTGRVNPVTVIEFLANTRGGAKAYESALTLETDGVTFNTAMMLAGLDKPPQAPTPAAFAKAILANAVDISVEVAGPPVQRLRADALIYDRATSREVPESHWVYFGSTIVDGRYLADVDGVLIGFTHHRVPVIDRVDTVGIGRYGEIILNPTLGLKAGTPVTVVVKSMAAPKN